MKFRRSLKTFDRIDITSLIDVISFLVIYFLVNATLEKSAAIKIELPRSSTSISKEKKSEDLIITVDDKGKIFFDRDPESVKLDRISEKINQLLGPKDKRDPKKNKVVIRGDKGARYQDIVKVIDQVNAAGVSKFNLSMVKGDKASDSEK